jgi:hypothetical protein
MLFYEQPKSSRLYNTAHNYSNPLQSDLQALLNETLTSPDPTPSPSPDGKVRNLERGAE